jgi:hypothetical protein
MKQTPVFTSDKISVTLYKDSVMTKAMLTVKRLSYVNGSIPVTQATIALVLAA